MNDTEGLCAALGCPSISALNDGQAALPRGCDSGVDCNLHSRPRLIWESENWKAKGFHQP